ncbi:MAG: tetratricopeptide repeat protein, partial [Gemmatimonadetes bacterium]|nr:tetratricopeptide repeat protein [Gemmatimonadota bacterium]NIT85435.1 tetratricopeptide repeat protein [Gemmatimonadota bacterium]NIU29252.1 tetratricopeptide repeat protein [Gemmatimonadota bacterium]NIX37741.1 tetratricopeptide repeat protein [Gemmatimonadota bacterium]
MDVLRYQGNLHRRLGRWDQAIRTWERVLELDPADASLAVTIAESYRSMRRYREAERYGKMAVSLDPTVPAHWWSLGRTHLERGDTASARTVLDSAVEQVEGRLLDYGRAAVHYFAEREGRSLALFRELYDQGSPLVLRAAAVNGRSDLVDVYADTLRARAARALAAIPDDDFRRRSVWLSRLGFAHAHLGNEALAERFVDEAVDLCPVSRDALVGPVRVH